MGSLQGQLILHFLGKGPQTSGVKSGDMSCLKSVLVYIHFGCLDLGLGLVDWCLGLGLDVVVLSIS